MSSSSDLHAATLAVIDRLPHDAAEVAREVFATDSDPLDVAVWLRSEGRVISAAAIEQAVADHDRAVWGVL